MEIFFFIAAVFILLDLALLRRRGPDIFLKNFSFSPSQQLFLGTVFLLGLSMGLFPHINREVLFPFLMIFILSLYFNRRLSFKRLLGLWEQGQTVMNSRTVLASETLELFLTWFVWMVGGVLVMRILGIFYPLKEWGLGELVAFSLYSSVIMCLLIARFSRRHAGLSFRELSGLQRNGKSFWEWLVFPFILGALWAGATGLLVMLRPVEVSTPFSQLVDTIDSPGRAMAFLSVAVLLAPFFEEVIFRGFLFYVIDRLGGKGLAIACVTGLFALMHVEQYWGDPLAIVVIAVLGFMLTVFRARTGSSLPSITAHYAFNGTMTVLPLLILLLSNPIYFEYQLRYDQLDNTAREAMLLRSMEEYPRHAATYNDLAWLYAEEGRNLHQALDLVDRALQISPDEYSFLDTKAEILYRLGRISEAVSIEEDLVRRYPHIPMLKDQLKKFSDGLNSQKN